MRRTTRFTAALAAVVTAFTLAGPAGATDRTTSTSSSSTTTTTASSDRLATPTAQRPRPSRFALTAAGYATQVRGGDIPAQADRTALAIINCTNETGRRKGNEIANVNLPGLGGIGVGETRLWTERRKGEVHVYSRHDVGGVTLMESSVGKLRLGAISSQSHVWHDGEKFHAEVDTSLGALTFTPTGGEPQKLELPGPGQTLPIPGLAKIELGHGRHFAKRDNAIAYGNALRIEFIPTGTIINVAHSTASMSDGITHGIMSGNAYGISAQALDGVVSVGRLPLNILPCRGTDGEVLTESVAGIGASSPLADVLKVGALETNVWGIQNARKATGYTESKLASINLGNGALVIDGIVAKATATRTRSGRITTSSAGSSLGSITVNGEVMEAPPVDPITIPGPGGEPLAEVAFNVVEKPRRNRITVTALRIRLLGDQVLVVNIGRATTMMRKSGL